MDKKTLSGFEFSPFFNHRLRITKNPLFIHGDFKTRIEDGLFTVEFNVWTKDLPSMKMNTIIQKSSVAELESAIIEFLALRISDSNQKINSGFLKKIESLIKK